MIKSRKKARTLLHSIEHLQQRHHSLRKDFALLIGEEDYRHIMSSYERCIEQLKESIKTLPLGHRYTGIFYTKIMDSIPARFKKHEGTVFLREDIISWIIIGDLTSTYYQIIYKEPKLDSKLTLDDCDLIYLKDADFLPKYIKEGV